MLVRSGLFTEPTNKNHVCRGLSGTKRQVYNGRTDGHDSPVDVETDFVNIHDRFGYVS